MLKKTIFAGLMSLMLVNAEAQILVIPSGSFAKGELAQTLNVTVSNDPSTAVLIHLSGQVSLPNGKTENLPNCDVYGKAIADRESGRIYISAIIIACKNQKDQFQYSTVNGDVLVIKDGKSGLAAQFIKLPAQEIATLDSSTKVDVLFYDTFKLYQ